MHARSVTPKYASKTWQYFKKRKANVEQNKAKSKNIFIDVLFCWKVDHHLSLTDRERSRDIIL
jgi:hypothetical protein